MYPIPANAARIQYLESTGTQYVDTGVVPTINTKFVYDMRLTDVENTSYFGSFSANNRFQLTNTLSNSRTVFRFACGISSDSAIDTNIAADTDRHLFSIDLGGGSCVVSVDDSTFTRTIGTSLVDGYSVYLLSRHNVNGASASKGALYAAKHYENGILCHDWVPVRVGTVGYLFDRMSGQLFGNQGTGDPFVLGPDDFSIFSHSVKHVEVVSSRPYDAEVEYIESTGTQYIDTGFDFASSHDFTISLYFDLLKRRDPSENNYLFSCIDSSAWLSCEIDRSSPYRAYANVGTKTLIYCGPSPYPFNSWDIFTFSVNVNSQQYTIAGGNWSTSGTYTGTLPSGRINLLTGRNLASTGSRPFVRIGYVKIWDNGTLVRDFVPVRVGTEYCLYDKANPTSGDNGDGLYHNKGTGAFLGGSDTGPSIVLAGRVLGDSSGTVKAVRKHYDMPVQYTIDECNGNAPTAVNVYFPSGKYSALNYTPTWEHHRFVGWYTSRYAPLEYVYKAAEADAYVDSGIAAENKGTWETDIRFSTSGNCRYIGVGTSGSTAKISAGLQSPSSTTMIPSCYETWNDSPLTTIDTTTRHFLRYVFQPGNQQFYCDGVLHMSSTKTSVTVPNCNIGIFECVNQDGTRHTYHKSRAVYLYECKLYNSSGVLVRHFLPVSDYSGDAALYDLVSNQLFYSQTSTKLEAGSAETETAVSPSDAVVFDRSTVYARWQLPTTVTFDATTNGGQMPSGWVSPDYYEGQPYGILPTPTKSGEVFLGWFTSGGTRVTTSSVVSAGTLTARYAAVTYDTSFQVTTTSSYRKTGIYSANRYSSSDPIVVDWGDGTTDVVYGNISQLAHTYSGASTYTVKISDNISTFCPSYSNTTWYQTTSQNQYTFKKVLTLSSKVTQLSSYAFYYCSAMTDAIIPSKATSIPTSCFYYCSQLKSSSVQLPSTVTSIGSYAFYYCRGSSFISIMIPASVTSIGSYAFANDNYLRNITFETSSSTLTLNTYAFSACFYSGSTAASIDLSPRKITSIPNYCFNNCRYLKGIVWPQGLTSIGGSAFRYCFYYTASTGTVEIPEGVTNISGTYAFANCLYLTAVTLPSTLTNLNNYTFYYCTRLATITSNRSTAPTVSSATFGNSSTYYTGRTYYSTGKNSLYVPAGATGYNASYWSSVLCNSSMCGFTLIENSIQEVEYITLTTAPSGTMSTNDGNILPIDVVPGTSTELEIDWVVNNSTGNILFGISSSSDSADFRIFSTNSNYYYDRGSGRLSPSYTTFGVGLGTRFKIKAGNYYLQNVTGGYTATGTSAAYTPQSPQCLGFWGYTTIYSCKVWDGNTLVRSLTPARIGQNGGLYDSVSGRFFRVIGNGAYTLGSDVTQ
jgi:hypothetical protein